MSTPVEVTWGYLYRGHTNRQLRPEETRPDEVVFHTCSSGSIHPFYEYDHEVALRLIERCKELGGLRFRLSPDLAGMLVSEDRHPETVMRLYGWTVECGCALPPNTVEALDQEVPITSLETTYDNGVVVRSETARLFIPRAEPTD